MGTIHELIQQHGRARARDMVPAKERRLVDLAADIMAEEELAFGITYSGFCQVSLPHRRLADDEVWLRQGSRVTLTIEPGVMPGTKRKIGVPFGAKARMVLLYLQTQALHYKTPEVRLGPNMHVWMDKMGVSSGGKSYHDLRDQMRRMALCHMMLSSQGGDRMEFTKDTIVQAGSFSTFDVGGSRAQGRLWNDTVRLSQPFFEALRRHPVPLCPLAIRALCNKSQALDIYTWLAYRLCALHTDLPISWDTLFQQFGGGYSVQRHFKRRFSASVRQALGVYPDAQVELRPHGLLLKPSKPPVPERLQIRA